MNDQTDQQLLRDYAERQSEAAFAAIVHRYVDLVYSAALRLSYDAHTAKDVTQSVFVALAQNTQQLIDRPVLAGWLHTTARNLTVKTIRSDARRRVREQEAVVMNELLSTNTDAGWEHVAPLLDNALSELDDTDRDAVLLRYFKNHDLRTVGAILGISDDAAQKRVSRAVERLREFFAKRGVTVGASGLAVVISANAVQAAPVGLAITISTAATLTGTALATTATVTATKAIAMTALQKTIVGATLAAAVGTGIYEARQNSKLRDQVQTLQQQQRQPLAELDNLRNENQQLAKLKVDADELTRLRGERNELLRLRGEVGQLRRQAAERNQPQAAGQSIDATFPIAPTSEAEFQLAQRQVSTMMFRVGSALRQFITNSPYGALVDTNGQPNPKIFENFAGLPLDNLEIQVKDIQSLAKAFDEKSRGILAVTKSPIFYDGYYTRFYLLADGTVRSDFSYSSDRQNFTAVYPSDEELAAMRQRAQENRSIPENLITLRKTLESVAKSFLAANNGRGPTDLAQLAPYATTQEQQAALQTLLELRAQQNTTSNNPAQ